ncbi:MAG TPA: hypothetical protein VLE73_06330 [Candidatus Saccharimonadales bacterium]|nr:hypothetical protein [Candidatus Saccharimonadales bacterium]
MKVLIPSLFAFGGLCLLTLLPGKTVMTTLICIGMIIGGIGMAFYNSRPRF